MARLIISIFIILFSFYLGVQRTKQLKQRLFDVEEYRKLICGLESAIRCLKKNMFEFFAVSDFKSPFIEYIVKNKDNQIDKAVEKYQRTKEEEEIIKIILPALIFAQNSSDITGISGALLHADEMLSAYQKQLKEDLDGKIKTTPYIYLLVGIFIAVIIV